MQNTKCKLLAYTIENGFKYMLKRNGLKPKFSHVNKYEAKTSKFSKFMCLHVSTLRFGFILFSFHSANVESE